MTAAVTHKHWAEEFQHEALFYAGLDDFLAGTVPFVREGLAGDEAILVAVPAVRLRALQGELQPDLRNSGAPVTFLDMEAIGHNPAHIIPAWSHFLRDNGGGAVPVRGIGEPIWKGRTDAELAECQRHESLLNVAFADSGVWRLLCPYDTVGLPGDVIAEAERSHPWVSQADGSRAFSTSCRELDAMARPFGAPLPPAAPDAEAVPFTLGDMSAVRKLVAVCSRAGGLSLARTDDLVLAVHEVVSNSIRHGGGAGTLRVWHDGRAVVCEVTDGGHITAPLAGRELPDDDSLGGRGLWMANQLCDLVQIRTLADGNVVRVHMHV